MAERIVEHCAQHMHDADEFPAVTLVFGCRSLQRAKEAQQQLCAQFPDVINSGAVAVELLQLDVSLPRSVVSACAEYRRRCASLSILY